MANKMCTLLLFAKKNRTREWVIFLIYINISRIHTARWRYSFLGNSISPFFRSLSRLLQGESEVSNDFGVHLRDLWQGNWIKLRFALKFIIYVSICSGQSYILPIALQNKQIVSLSCRIFGFASWFQLQHVYINTRNIIKIVFRISNQIIRHATKMFGQFWPQHNSMSNTKKIILRSDCQMNCSSNNSDSNSDDSNTVVTKDELWRQQHCRKKALSGLYKIVLFHLW